MEASNERGCGIRFGKKSIKDHENVELTEGSLAVRVGFAWRRGENATALSCFSISLCSGENGM